MKLYVIRHGQTDWNILGKVQGCTDIELNETGIKQAENAKEKFNQYDIDLILYSPLKRTKKTAEIINQDKKVPMIREDKIIERNFGDYEGILAKDIMKQKNFWDYQANEKDGNVESIVEICDKVWKFLDEVKEKYQDKSVLLVTHGGTARVINSYFEGTSEEGFFPKGKSFQNCEILEYEL